MRIYCKACEMLVDETVDVSGCSVCAVCKRKLSLDGVINELQSGNAPKHPAAFKFIEHESETEYVFRNPLSRRNLAPIAMGWAMGSLWGIWPILVNSIGAPGGRMKFAISFNISAFSALLYFLFKSKVRFSQGCMHWAWKHWPLALVSGFEVERQSDVRGDKSYIVAANIEGQSKKLFHYTDKAHAEFVQFRLNQALAKWTGRGAAKLKRLDMAG